MGQKVNPKIMRISSGYADYLANWIDLKTPGDTLNEDLNIRNFIATKYAKASISDVYIERFTGSIKVTIYTARSGALIGRGAGGIDKLRKEISKLASSPCMVMVEEIKDTSVVASLVARGIADSLERRMPFRRAMKRAADNAARGSHGIKICVAGRLAGAEIARSEWLRRGRVPLHTFKANIDYAEARAATTYGIIGVKVWIYVKKKPAKKGKKD